jgi:hypothetical protein
MRLSFIESRMTVFTGIYESLNKAVQRLLRIPLYTSGLH